MTDLGVEIATLIAAESEGISVSPFLVVRSSSFEKSLLANANLKEALALCRTKNFTDSAAVESLRALVAKANLSEELQTDVEIFVQKCGPKCRFSVRVSGDEASRVGGLKTDTKIVKALKE